MSRLVKFWRLSRREQQAFFEAGILLALCTACVAAIPFRYIDRFLSVHCKARSQRVLDRDATIAIVTRFVCRATKILPWTSLCLSRSMAEVMMLRRRGIPAVMFAGVRFDEHALLAAH